MKSIVRHAIDPELASEGVEGDSALLASLLESAATRAQALSLIVSTARRYAGYLSAKPSEIEPLCAAMKTGASAAAALFALASGSGQVEVDIGQERVRLPATGSTDATHPGNWRVGWWLAQIVRDRHAIDQLAATPIEKHCRPSRGAHPTGARGCSGRSMRPIRNGSNSPQKNSSSTSLFPKWNFCFISPQGIGRRSRNHSSSRWRGTRSIGAGRRGGGIRTDTSRWARSRLLQWRARRDSPSRWNRTIFPSRCSKAAAASSRLLPGVERHSRAESSWIPRDAQAFGPPSNPLRPGLDVHWGGSLHSNFL